MQPEPAIAPESSLDTLPSVTPPGFRGRLAEWGRRLLRWLPAITRLIGVLCGIAIIVVAATELVRHRMTHIVEVDSQGYFLMARSFAEGEWPRWEEDFARFRGHVWIDTGEGKVTTKYPPGGPLLLAIGYWFGGFDGAMWVNTVLTIIGLIAFFLLAWDLFGSIPAAICMFIWAFSPMLLFYGQYPLAHSAEICVAVLALMLAVRWGRTGSVFFAIGAGLCAGYLPLIRPTTILLLLPLAGAYLATGGAARFRATTRRVETTGAKRGLHLILAHWPLLVALAAVATPLLLLAWYNTNMFGRPWWSGYHFSDEDSAFNWTDWRTRLSQMVQRRGILLEDEFWIACLLGLWLRTGGAGLPRVLALWVLPTIALYTGYYFFSASPAFLRFFLPMVAVVILCAGLPFRRGLLSGAPAQWAALLGFALLCYVSPPSFFAAGSEPSAGRRPAGFDASDETQRLLRNTGGPPPLPPALLTAAPPTTVYGSAPACWHASVYPGVTAYDLAAWTDRHFIGRASACPDTMIDGIRMDVRRHQQVHGLYEGKQPADLRADFLRHVTQQLTAGQHVVLQANDQNPLLKTLTQTAALLVEPIPGDAAPLWRVTLRSPATSP